jgi:hypothetical protein
VNNLFYFPSLLLFGAANALIPFGADHLADNRVYSVTFVLGFVWTTTGRTGRGADRHRHVLLLVGKTQRLAAGS